MHTTDDQVFLAKRHESCGTRLFLLSPFHSHYHVIGPESCHTCASHMINLPTIRNSKPQLRLYQKLVKHGFGGIRKERYLRAPLKMRIMVQNMMSPQVILLRYTLSIFGCMYIKRVVCRYLLH